ncbi:hypothetical protein ABN028_20080 [Actinopolymorpha sp. B17G11]|uniref:hypothetical protein n=1 Tax=Actinopolymorpha sp. B17G11 TaxID=3160861 RepID=UPI0032E45354
MTVVPTEDVARLLGLPDPLPADKAWQIEQALLDAEGAVVGHIGRPIVAVEKTLTDQYPVPGIALTDPDAWPDAQVQLDDRIKVLETTATEGGRFTVRFLVGLDVANDPELRRIYTFIRDSAVESLRNNPDGGIGTRRVSSVSAEGQSVSYANDTPGGAAAPGAPPTLDSLNRWKRRAAYMRRTPRPVPWPYAGDTRSW